MTSPELRRGRASIELARRRREVVALAEVARAVNQSLDPVAVLSTATSAVATALELDGAILRTLDPATGRLTIADTHGVSDAFVDGLRVLGFGEGLAGEVVLSDAPLVVEDARDDPRLPWDVARAEGLRSVAVVPIRARGHFLGTMAVFTRGPRAFRADDLALLQAVADQVGVALENARLYEDLRRRRDELETVAKLKDEFAATVSHELRTPMTVVKTAFDALLHDWEHLTEKRRLEYLRLGQGGADRLKRLLEDMLLVAQIEEARAQVQARPIEPCAVVEAIVSETRTRQPRRIDVAVSPEVPRVRADPARLGDVVRRLLDNALRYSVAPAPVSVSLHRDGNGVIIAVEDRGVGIAPHDQPRLFRRFERVDRTVRAEAGTGLGLYICRSLVEAMGGSIALQSQLGVGSTFSVRLPVHAD